MQNHLDEEITNGIICVTPQGEGTAAETTETDMGRKPQGRHKNYSGTLHQRASGVWEVRIMYRGKRHTINTHERDRKKAEKARPTLVKVWQEKSERDVLCNLKARIEARGLDIADSDRAGKHIMLAELADKFVSLPVFVDKSEGTRTLNAAYIKSLVKWLAANRPAVKEMKDVTLDVAKAFVADMANTTTPNTYNLRLNAYCRAWELLGDDAGCTINPFEYGKGKPLKKREKDESRQRELLTTDDITRLFATLKDDAERLLFGLGAYCGLRKGDCATIKYGNVNLQTGIISIRPIKTHRKCKQPLHIKIAPQLRPLLEAVMTEGHAPEDYIMPHFGQQYVDGKKAFSERLERRFAEAGLQNSTKDEKGFRVVKYGFHSLRVWFASMATYYGIEPFVVQEILGHSTYQMTMHYQRSVQQAQSVSLEALPDIAAKADEMKALELLKAACREGETVLECAKRLVGTEQSNAAFAIAS